MSALVSEFENLAAPDLRPGASREISAAHTLLGVCPVGRSSSSQLITQSTNERPLFQKGVSALVALKLQVNYPSAGASAPSSVYSLQPLLRLGRFLVSGQIGRAAGQIAASIQDAARR